MRKANAVLSSVFFLCLSISLHAQDVSTNEGQLLVFPPIAGHISVPSGLAAPQTVPSDTEPKSVAFGQAVRVWTVWYINTQNCTNIATGSLTASNGPKYGSVTTVSGSAPLPPGYPCAGVVLPEVTAFYTWDVLTTVTVIDFFHLQFEATNGVTAATDWQAELVGEGDGILTEIPGACATCDPINIGTGDVFEQVTDYETAGQNKLSFIRYYNSLGVPNTFASTLGQNWRSNYDRYISFVSSTFTVAERPDGQLLNFTLKGGVWTPDSDVDYKLTKSGTTWTLTDHDDTVETYSLPIPEITAKGALVGSIKARNGYTQTLHYASGQLQSVTDTYGRKLSFTYDGGALQTVTTPDTLILTYSYNTIVGGVNNQLASVSYNTTPATNQQYLYEQSGLPFALTNIVDENGNTFATWTYDQFARGLTSQLGKSADLTTIVYDDATGARTVTNAFGEQDTYDFKVLQEVPKVTQIDRQATSTTVAATRLFTYNANGYTASQTDWNGNKTSYVNDVHGQPTTITEPTRTTKISYDDPVFVHLPHQIVTAGLTTTFGYDSRGDLLTRTLLDTTTTTVPYVTKGEQRIWKYTWLNSLLASVQTPRTNVTGLTHFTYYASGALQQITNALGQKTTITARTGGGLPEIIVDPNNVTTTLAYDGRLHLHTSTVKTSKGNLTTTFTYDAAENLQSVQLPDGSTQTNGYDTAHRLTSVTDLFGESVAYTLDALGDQTLTNVSDATKTVKWTHSGEFDALGRIIHDIGGVANQTTVVTYDKNGNALAITDPLTNKTTQGFDALNRLDKITDPAPGGITNITFDTHDRPLTVTAPNGARTAYVYDGFGDAIQVTNPDTGVAVYHYDPDGNLTQSTNAARAVANYTYDALDRVLTTTYPSDAAENVTYTYDQTGHGFGVGRLTSVADAAGALSRNYDERGNLLSEKRTRTTATLTTVYAYDAAGRVASITYPSKWLVSYSRDSMGRVIGVTATKPGGSATPVVSNVTYGPFGPVTGMTFGNGVAEARSFDLDYRLGTLTDKGTASLQSLTYGYDADNNVKTITDALKSANSQTLGSDALNRLNSATGEYGTLTYTYDKSGNRLTEKRGIVTTTYRYTANANILDTLAIGTTTTETFGYTASGNINSFNPGIMAAGSSPITGLTYNQANRLATVLAGTTQVAGYTYDAFGHRIVKNTGATTLYQHDQAGHLLEEASSSGVPRVDYIYLAGMPLATIAPATGKLYFIHNDKLGTPQLATDSTQAIAWQATYQPFGATTGTVSGLITQNLRLPGQQFDAETGFNHNGFRDYSSAWGRYIESDPVGLMGGLNSYSYGIGNPVKFTDETGLESGDGAPYPTETWPWPINHALAAWVEYPSHISYPGRTDHTNCFGFAFGGGNQNFGIDDPSEIIKYEFNGVTGLPIQRGDRIVYRFQGSLTHAQVVIYAPENATSPAQNVYVDSVEGQDGDQYSGLALRDPMATANWIVLRQKPCSCSK